MVHEFTQSDAEILDHPLGWTVQVRPALYLRANGEVGTNPAVWRFDHSAKAAITRLLPERSRVDGVKHKTGFFGRVMSSAYTVT